jgi:hypothetical protein
MVVKIEPRIVYTCKPPHVHKYSLVIITPRIFSSQMLSSSADEKDRDSIFTTVNLMSLMTIWKPSFSSIKWDNNLMNKGHRPSFYENGLCAQLVNYLCGS